MDILDAALPHGTQSAFAKKIGVSRQWLHRICQSDLIAMPSEEVARRITEYLPSTKQNASAFLEHWQAWQQLQQGVVKKIRKLRSHPEVSSLLDTMTVTHRLMAHSINSQETQRQFQKMLQLGELLVHNLNYHLFPLEYVRAATMLSEVYTTIALPVAALYWSKQARILIQHLDLTDCRNEHTRFLDYAINICRHEGEAYVHLGLHRKANECYQRAESYFNLHPQPEYWIPFISLSRLSMLPMKGRFVLADAEALAITIEKKCERAGFEPWTLSINEHLARVYIAYGNMKKAQKVLIGLTSLFDTVGLRQQFMVYRTLARFFWMLGDKAQWSDALRTALALSQDAGLTSSYDKLLAEYNSSAIN